MQHENTINDSQGAKLDNGPAAEHGVQPENNAHSRASEGEPVNGATAATQAVARLEQARLWGRIPQALKERPQWCVATHDKKPLRADYTAASSTDPSTWVDFNTACTAAYARGLGIGYMLHESDPFTCIDLDIKDDTPPESIQQCKDDIKLFDSYTEHSTSGKGYHIWVEGNIGAGRKVSGVEIYSQERFMICTGNVVNNIPIAERQHLVEQYVVANSPLASADTNVDPIPDGAEVETDEAVLQRAFKASNGDKVKALYLGGMGAVDHEDHSKADASLMQLLAHYTANNAQLQRLFLASALGQREKAKRKDYLPRTIEHARTMQAQDAKKSAGAAAHGKEMYAQMSAGSKAGRLEEALQDKPRNIIKKYIPEPFQRDEVPESIGNFAHEVSQATGFDISGLIHSAVTSAAAIIDDRYQLEARKGWLVSARSWGVLIASSAAGKSPTIRFSSDPIKAIHNVEIHRWRRANENVEPKEQEPMPSRYSSDATIAALSERLKDNPRGILMLTEEFSSWIGGIDSSSKGEAAQNKGAWLQLRDGGPQQIDRINRGPVTIQNWGASVLAACTPGGLARQMKEMPEDGLIQRFVPCIMRNPDLDAPERNLDPTPAIEHWGEWLRYADEMTTKPAPQICLRFDAEAQIVFNAEVKEIRTLASATEDFSAAYASHLGKHPGILAEMCIVFHTFSGKNCSDIDVDTLRIAIRYMQRVRKHAAYLYSAILTSSPAFELARGLARSIVAADEVLPTIGRDWMTQHCLSFKKADDRVRREAVQVLIDADWLEAPASIKLYAGWPSKYLVNEQVFQLFASHGEEWRKRREAVRDMIGDRET